MMSVRTARATLAIILGVLCFAPGISLAQSEPGNGGPAYGEDLVYEELIEGTPREATQYELDLMASNRGLAVASDVSATSYDCYSASRQFGDYRFTYYVAMGWCVDYDAPAIYATSWDYHLVSTNWSTQLSWTENLNCWNNYGHGIQQSAECGVNLGFCSAWGPSGCIDTFYPWARTWAYYGSQMALQVGGY